jgi:hypothetical protein
MAIQLTERLCSLIAALATSIAGLGALYALSMAVIQLQAGGAIGQPPLY